MTELGVITIEGNFQDPADESWFLGPHKCGVIFFRCPVPGHDHLNVIRVSETNPVSSYEGDIYKNIWKMDRLKVDLVSISPSILQKDDFHCGIPTYFKLVDKETIYGLDPIEPTVAIQQ